MINMIKIEKNEYDVEFEGYRTEYKGTSFVIRQLGGLYTLYEGGHTDKDTQYLYYIKMYYNLISLKRDIYTGKWDELEDDWDY